MAFIVRDTDQMAEMLQHYISRLQRVGDSGQMLILPIIVASKPDEALKMLAGVEQFSELEPSDPCTDGALGVLRFPSEPTVHDAIRELEGSGMKSVHYLMKAIEAALPTTTPEEVAAARAALVAGTATVVNMGPMGKLPIDRAKFAEVVGLPLKGSSLREYRVALYPAKDSTGGNGSSERLILVATVGNPDGSGPTDDLLSPYFPRIENRGSFDNYTSFKVPGLKDGWQLRGQAKFVEMISKLRQGYGFVVRKLGDDGLSIEY